MTFETLAEGVTLHLGDCLVALDTMEENSIDAVVCDPPYHLTSIVKRFGAENAAPAQFGKDGAFSRASRGFMGKQWDGGDIAFRPDTWAKVLRVLKPGGHLVAFSGTRTYHRMTVAIEDGGFEIRDQLAWCYGSGFPKSHNLSGDWQGWGTALKPSWEPICLARKPLSEITIAANVLKWGTGALNIDATRIETGDDLNGGRYSDAKKGDDGNTFGAGINLRSKNDYAQPVGRWPANLAHDGSEEVLAGFPETGAAKASNRGLQHSGRHGGLADIGGNIEAGTDSVRGHDDSGGSAARFFYTAKADATDRAFSKHPTVKPVSLMRWLVRMVTPPGGTVLDPFAGTGTTGQAAMEEGFNAVLIEREEEYQADIRRRISLVFAGEIERGKHVEQEPLESLPLFGDAAE